MGRSIRRILPVLASLLLGIALARETPRVNTTLPGTPVVLSVSADDPVMHRAIRRARSELADFLELAEKPPRHLTNFAVRVALLERNQGEYIWIANFKEGDNSRFAGVVAGDIVMQSRFKRGDPFTFARGDIADWMYTDTRTGRVHGAYTECALLTHGPAEAAARIRREKKLDCEF